MQQLNQLDNELTALLFELLLSERDQDADVFGNLKYLLVNERVDVFDELAAAILEAGYVDPEQVLAGIWVLHERRNKRLRLNVRMTNLPAF